jgi:hypothetical protein
VILFIRFVAITVRFLDQNFDFHSAVLGVYNMDWSHTAENIRELWDRHLSKGIFRDATLFSCTTDNGANFRKVVCVIPLSGIHAN